MNWFLNITTRTKLFLSFGLMIMLLVVVIIAAYFNIKTIEESQKALFEKNFTVALDLVELKSNLNRQRSNILEMTIASKKSDQEILEQDIKEQAKTIDERMERLLDKNKNDLKLVSKLEELKVILNAYRQTREGIFVLIYAGKIDEARQMTIGIQDERFEKIRLIAIELGREKEEEAKTAIAQSEQRINEMVRVFVTIGVGGILIAIAMTVLLGKVIANPLKEISDVAGRIASGDLTANVPSDNRTDEMGTLTKVFRTMVDGLKNLTMEISEGINILAASASEILATTTQVATSAAETATAVSETTTTVEEVKQTAVIVAQKARYVSENAQKTAQVSLDGKKSVEQSIEGMQRIQNQMESIAESIVRLSEQTHAISEIITTVNDFAEQSNLLAVNAAIEAAKAGEQGKGFAVVAQEVKSLAEQSKQATAQVRTILSEIQKATSAAVMVTEQGSKAVETGMKQSTDAGESIRILADGVVEAAQAATQIAASSQQQLVGMDQVALAMENIKQASTQNVVGTKQTETAAQTLHDLGQRLKRLAERYRV